MVEYKRRSRKDICNGEKSYEITKKWKIFKIRSKNKEKNAVEKFNTTFAHIFKLEYNETLFSFTKYRILTFSFNFYNHLQQTF